MNASEKTFFSIHPWTATTGNVAAGVVETFHYPWS
jgi:hypothetical protein